MADHVDSKVLNHCVWFKILTKGGQLIPDGRIMWLWGARSGPSRCGGAWPSGAIIFLGGAAMELACIRAMLERTASQPSSPACEDRQRRAIWLYQLNQSLRKDLQHRTICISDNMAFAKLAFNDNNLSDTRLQVKLFVTTLVVSKNKPISYGRGLSCWADVTLLWCMWAQGQGWGQGHPEIRQSRWSGWWEATPTSLI